MIVFWVLVALISSLCGLLIFRSAAGPDVSTPLPPGPAVLDRQLSELEGLVASGQMSAEDARLTRAEIARLALREAKAGQVSSLEGGRVAVVMAVVVCLLSAAAMYLLLGAPGMPDQPMSARIAAWGSKPATLDPQRMAVVMQAITARRPNDPLALKNLALARFAADEPAQAIAALRRAIALRQDDPSLWILIGEAYIGEAEGELTPDARAAFQQASKLDPKAAAPRYYLSLALIADGHRAEGQRGLEQLLADLEPEDPRAEGLRQEIASLGHPVPPQSPPQAGTDSGSVTAPMIQAMVERLAGRLKTHPEDPEGWIRLIRSYAVLGRNADRDAALAQARQRFAADSRIQERLTSAARGMQ